jgi:hypothetical protein
MKILIILKNINNNIVYYPILLLRDPLFLFLIIIIIYVILFIYLFADPILCQGEASNSIASPNEPVQETIESLKTSLQSHTINFNKVYGQYLTNCSLYEEGLKRRDISFDIMNPLDNLKSNALKYAMEYITEIRNIEKKIKVIDIAYKSSIPKKWFEFQ